MKLLIALSLALISTSAHADVSFLKESALPQTMQEKISKRLLATCSTSVLEEVSTTLRLDRIDQGVVDEYYTTRLIAKVKVDQYIFDQYEVVVESAIWSFSNPTAGDNHEIISVNAENRVCR